MRTRPVVLIALALAAVLLSACGGAEIPVVSVPTIGATATFTPEPTATRGWWETPAALPTV